MGRFKDMLLENGCIYGSKLCDDCQECFEFEDRDLENGLSEDDYQSIYNKIQDSSLTEDEKKTYYEKLFNKLDTMYDKYASLSTLWQELKDRLA